jgi:hypothetical protein
MRWFGDEASKLRFFLNLIGGNQRRSSVEFILASDGSLQK